MSTKVERCMTCGGRFVMYTGDDEPCECVGKCHTCGNTLYDGHCHGCKTQREPNTRIADDSDVLDQIREMSKSDKITRGMRIELDELVKRRMHTMKCVICGSIHV